MDTIILESTSNSNEISKKITKFIKIIISLACFIFLNYLIIKLLYQSNNLDNIVRSLEKEYDEIALNKGLENKQLQNQIIPLLTNKTYEGTWTSNKTLSGFNETDGKIEIRFMLGKDSLSQENIVIIIIKCLEENYIDNWKLIHSYTKINDIQMIHNDKDTIEFIGNFTSTQGDRKIFQRTSIDKLIKAKISLYILKDSNGLIDYEHFNLSYISFDSINSVNSSLSLQNDEEKHKKLNEKISFYVFISSTTATLSMLVNFYLIKILTQGESNIKAISLTFISINALWDAYCSMMNLSFAIKHPAFTIQLGILTGLYFALFLLVDIQFLYYYWRIKKRIVTYEQFQHKKKVFYIFYYLGLCLTIYFIYDFFFIKKYILLLPLILWIPQIVHNIRVNNDITLPLIYIICQTVARMTNSLYFRGYSRNCFDLSSDSYLIIYCLLIITILYFIIGCQAIFGARFFLPFFLRKKRHEEIYYYTQYEAMNNFPNKIDEECVICLTKLFTHETQRNLNINDLALSSISQFDQESKFSEILPKYINIFTSLLFDFHEWKFKSKKIFLPYMATQCNHVFHSQCLELWLRRMKKCPSCRKEVSIIPV